MSNVPTGSTRRFAPRVVPKEPVLVAMESAEGAIAQGFVANISETGACVRTEVGFAPGSELLLRLDFSRHPQPFSATGRVVWQGGSSSVGAGAIGHGVQWTYDGPHRVRLRLAIRALVGQA